MPITDILEHNATLFKNDVSLVELNPENSMYRPTDLQIFFFQEESKKATRLQYFL